MIIERNEEMEMDAFFTLDERKLLPSLYRKLLVLLDDALQKEDCVKLRTCMRQAVESGSLKRDLFGFNPIVKDMQTAIIVAEEIGMKRASVLGLMLHNAVMARILTVADVEEGYGSDVAGIVRGLIKVNELYAKSPSIESENFRNLLLSFVEDMRVILIMI